MSEFEDEKVKKFMEEMYPEYKGNLPLGRILYQKAMNKNPIIKKVGSQQPEEKTIEETKKSPKGTKVCIKGIVVEVQKNQYEGCSKCKKSVNKNCGCDAGTEKFDTYSFLIGDDTGMIWAGGFGKAEFEVGNEVQVVGQVTEYKGDKELQSWEVNVLADTTIKKAEKKNDSGIDVKVNRILKSISDAGMMKHDVFKTMMKCEGIQLKDIEDRLIIDTDNDVVYCKKPYGK